MASAGPPDSKNKKRMSKSPPPLPPARRAAKEAPPVKAPAREPRETARPRAPRPAFPKRSQQPTPPAFAAQLPLSLGKRLDLIRTFLLKQKGVLEDVYFYGPESGWALRYLHEGKPLCSMHIYDQLPVGILSLEAAAAEAVDWRALSPAARKARQQAHGTPSLLWLDVPLEGDGATDFRALLRAKIAIMSQAKAVADRGSARTRDQLADDDDLETRVFDVEDAGS